MVEAPLKVERRFDVLEIKIAGGKSESRFISGDSTEGQEILRKTLEKLEPKK